MESELLVIIVIGIGADGVSGLSYESYDELARARIIYGSFRQLKSLDENVTSNRHIWPSPILPILPNLLNLSDVHVLASGDPLQNGIGSVLINIFGEKHVKVLPHISCTVIATSRMGWSIQNTEIVNLINNPIYIALRHSGKAIILSRNSETPIKLARFLNKFGYGNSEFTILEQLGGIKERRQDIMVRDYIKFSNLVKVDNLNVIAVNYQTDLYRTHSLPDNTFANDGQITKQSIRAVTLSNLGPKPGELLWDIGSGSGSIAIEWARSAPGCTAIAFERNIKRRNQIISNIKYFGVNVNVRGEINKDIFNELKEPAAIFVGGGITKPGLLKTCFESLPIGGRLVANAVTFESESILMRWYLKKGGNMQRYQNYQCYTIGKFTSWRPTMPVTQWSLVKL